MLLTIGKMEVLKNQRKYKRSEITKTLNLIERSLGSLDVHSKLQYIDYLSQLGLEVSKLNRDIFELMVQCDVDESVLDPEYESCAEYDRNLSFSITSLRHSMQENYKQFSIHAYSCENKLATNSIARV